VPTQCYPLNAVYAQASRIQQSLKIIALERLALDDKSYRHPYFINMTEEKNTPDLETTQTQTAESHPASSFASAPPRFETFEAFYPYYIGEHSLPNTRRLHVIGTGLAILCLTQVVMWGVIGGFWSLIWAGIFGYGFAWAAHFFVEKNKPATFTYPAWSLMGDFKMFWEVVTRKRAW
jgi:hypothetical protein